MNEESQLYFEPVQGGHVRLVRLNQTKPQYYVESNRNGLTLNVGGLCSYLNLAKKIYDLELYKNGLKTPKIIRETKVCGYLVSFLEHEPEAGEVKQSFQVKTVDLETGFENTVFTSRFNKANDIFGDTVGDLKHKIYGFGVEKIQVENKGEDSINVDGLELPFGDTYDTTKPFWWVSFDGWFSGLNKRVKVQGEDIAEAVEKAVIQYPDNAKVLSVMRIK